MTDIKKEINYISERAIANDSRIVRLDGLLLFSTETGDAWILDIEDNFAICLLRNGEKQKYKIIDTPTQFGFDWDYKYTIDGDKFILIAKTGNMKTITGYPTREIMKQIKAKY